ncbi:MAG: thymidine kinase [Candidatus Pacebacteria bacterium]|nr:thymidine kinase [Candidatus Paceibacterota bacterium]
MPKLYFRYGCMGSSKTANALMVKFNYEEKGYKVALMKPSIDDRDGADIIKSRIGLQSKTIVISKAENIKEWYLSLPNKPDVIIVDEAQFLTESQVNQLKDIAIEYIPVLCFGLKSDFMTHLFEGSKRLFEIADSIQEIKSICKCGRKAEVNARVKNGKIIDTGNQIEIGGNESYIGVCYKCWKEGLTSAKEYDE